MLNFIIEMTQSYNDALRTFNNFDINNHQKSISIYFLLISR